MATILLLATNNGVVICDKKDGKWSRASQGLNNRRVTAVSAQNRLMLAGTLEGVFISEDMGIKWKAANQGLTSKHIRWLSSFPQAPELEFAGTEPAGIFVSYEGGRAWRSCSEVAQMRDQYNWQLPYSPQAGCVRGFAFHGMRGYAAVEDGGVLFSHNSGETWALAGGSTGEQDHTPGAGMVHSDVHSVEVHPTSPELVFAATGGGLYRTNDGGNRWERLYQCYCRAVWIDPHDPDHIILGPADSVDRNGRIEVSHNGGQSWEQNALGLEMPWPDAMVERFVVVEAELLAILSNGEMFGSRLPALEWQQEAAEVQGINAAAALPV